MILIKNIHTVCPRSSVPFFIVNTIENGLLLLGHTVPSLSVVLSILYSEVRFDKMDKTSLTPSLKKCFTNWSETHAILYLLQIIIFYFHFTVLSTIVLCVKEVLSNSTEGKILRKLDKTSWTDVVLAYFSINSKSATEILSEILSVQEL